MPHRFVDDWPAMFSFRDCLPRSEFPYTVRRVTGNLYRFADQGYVHLGRLPQVDDGRAPNCLRILKLFWARNDQAAIVAAHLHHKTAANGVCRWQKIHRKKLEVGNPVPPQELLRNLATGWTHGDTFRAARKHKSLVRESASYDGSGQFLYKTVSIPRLEIRYASRSKNEAELPMAVEILPDRKPKR